MLRRASDVLKVMYDQGERLEWGKMGNRGVKLTVSAVLTIGI